MSKAGAEGGVSWVQVLQRLPAILECMGVPSEDEELVFLTQLLQVPITVPLLQSQVAE